VKRLNADDVDPPERGDGDSDDSTVMLKKLSLGYGLFFFVVSIELMIKWNHIEGLYQLNNTGQLIPFIVSLYGLAQLIYNFVDKFSSGKYDLDDDTTCFCCFCTCPPQEKPRWAAYATNYGGF